MCSIPTCSLTALDNKTYRELIPIIEESSVTQKNLEQKIVCSAEESEPSFSLNEDDRHEGHS